MAKAGPDKTGRRIDPLTTAAVIFFLIAVVFAGAPMLNAGPATLAGLLLLIGLAGVSFLGLFVLRAGVDPQAEPEPGAEKFIAALTEPAAVAASDGRIVAANAAWREVVGASPRLPKGGASAATLFAALTSAKRGEIARACLKANGVEHHALVAPLAPRRFLIRLSGQGLSTLALPSAAMEVIAAVAAAGRPPPKVLDAFAAASPFGAALLDGEDPFAAVIVEANPALRAVAGGGEAGQAFGELIEPASRADATERLAAANAGGAPLEVRLAYDPTRIAHLYLTKTDGRWVAYLVDVSEQKQIELQLSQSQKM